MQESSCRRDRVTFFVVLASVFVANLAYNMLTTALPSVMADFEIDAIAGQLPRQATCMPSAASAP